MAVLFSPESAGVHSGAVLDFVNALDRINYVHSFLLSRNGREIASGWWKPYDPETPHLLFSLSKSFVSCAVGLLADEGKITLDTPVTEIFPEYCADIADEKFFRMTVRHLLTMSAGHDRCATEFFRAAGQNDFVKVFFSSPLVHEPGSVFVYNSGATYLLSAIVRKLSGQNVTEYLAPRMLNDLGIAKRKWETCPAGTEFGGWGYRLTTREIAAFAEMLLNKGKVNGKQLVPAHYLEQACSFQIDNSRNEAADWRVGYGFQFWRCRNNAFRGDGAFGQYALVIPEKRVTLAITSGVSDMQQILDAVWEHLLPAFGSGPLPEDPGVLAALREKCSTLAVPALHGKGPAEERTAEIVFNVNPVGISGCRIDLKKAFCRVVFRRENAPDTAISAGWEGNFAAGETDLEEQEMRQVFSTAAAYENSVRIRSCYTGTPYLSDYTFEFDGNAVRFRRKRNRIFQDTEWPELTGKLV